MPLARALGVTADDLLDAEKPVRALTRADWQGLLSFAFALGGGLLFYLLATFAPLLVCYAVYLACLCYGAYLQRYYARHSRWFWLGAAGMNVAVNFSAALGFVALAQVLVQMGPAVLLAQIEMDLGTGNLWMTLLLSGALAVGVTALTVTLLHRRFATGTPEGACWAGTCPGAGRCCRCSALRCWPGSGPCICGRSCRWCSGSGRAGRLPGCWRRA